MIKYITLLLFLGTGFSKIAVSQEQKSTLITVKSPEELYVGAVLEKHTINSPIPPVLNVILDNIVVNFGGLNVKSKVIKTEKTSFYKAIEEALQGKRSDNRRFSFDIKELNGYNDVSLYFGQQIDLASWFSITETAKKPRTLLAINMEKIAFTVDMDLPAEGTFNTNKELLNKYDINDLIYINTLSFGRKAVVIVESDLAGTLVKEALSAQLKGNKLADKERAVLANCNYHVAFLGGRHSDLDFSAGQLLQQLINYIDTTLDVNNYGDPIAYKAAYLKNHQIFYNSY
ncbi:MULTISPECIES: thiol-activated cytolysin family protein [Sphingobacterium]|jgi:hypothetical protein|uniref:Thiol-activated cytolysin family protein n=1 Tax=Sphingobacterium paramultivorum TaxID=2886510 RepID=A0A7G5E464_9SPHI|nr:MULTISPECIES: thiol-activated cytolysin family protein [Sphingobacterium]MCS4165273.1 hypothetical protein [Sphingobacterium sp. BIGb0116]QMV68789.1 thiol-activated cytolysin family protein [Sphingobacterium paramultivorum]WSO12553.1 thiol-activated cytolysin family protein [Sphingobacterium paramultivorum]